MPSYPTEDVTPEGTEYLKYEVDYLENLTCRLDRLQTLLSENALPAKTASPITWFRFLASIKTIVGNASQDLSFVAVLMAKHYLKDAFPLLEFDAGLKPQGAPGLDIDEVLVDGRRLIGEVKTTTPYGGNDLGAAQKKSFLRDFEKLSRTSAHEKYFFVTDRATFDIVCRKYHVRLPEVRVVLLPEGDEFPSLIL